MQCCLPRNTFNFKTLELLTFQTFRISKGLLLPLYKSWKVLASVSLCYLNNYIRKRLSEMTFLTFPRNLETRVQQEKLLSKKVREKFALRQVSWDKYQYLPLFELDVWYGLETQTPARFKFTWLEKIAPTEKCAWKH